MLLQTIVAKSLAEQINEAGESSGWGRRGGVRAGEEEETKTPLNNRAPNRLVDRSGTPLHHVLLHPRESARRKDCCEEMITCTRGRENTVRFRTMQVAWL